MTQSVKKNTRSVRMRKKRRYLYHKQKGYCAICGEKMVLKMHRGPTEGMLSYEATIDHIIPLGDGGTNRIKNMQAACYSCNHTKGSLKDTILKLEAIVCKSL